MNILFRLRGGLGNGIVSYKIINNEKKIDKMLTHLKFFTFFSPAVFSKMTDIHKQADSQIDI